MGHVPSLAVRVCDCWRSRSHAGASTCTTARTGDWRRFGRRAAANCWCLPAVCCTNYRDDGATAAQCTAYAKYTTAVRPAGCVCPDGPPPAPRYTGTGARVVSVTCPDGMYGDGTRTIRVQHPSSMAFYD